MATKGHLLYYPEGKHDILLGKELNDVLKSKVNSVTKVTYLDLKDLRDNSKLIPGSLYRITDYQCTTTQENTQSAGHQFDIVLLALSEDKLAEEGWAMIHDGVTEFDDYDIYNITFTDDVTKQFYLKQGTGGYNVVDVETFKGVREVSDSIFDVMPDIETKTATMVVSSEEFINEIATEDFPYNYFQNSNLSAWKVWYCLDNDKSRFAWADDSVDESTEVAIVCTINNIAIKYYRNPLIDGLNPMGNPVYGWSYEGLDIVTSNSVYTTTLEIVPSVTKASSSLNGRPNININEYTPAHEGTNLPNGRGVIYRLIDEWNNDVAYDFKNIQYVRKLTDGKYDPDNGTETWVYTFTNTEEGEITDATAKSVDLFVNSFIERYCSGLKLSNNAVLTMGNGSNWIRVEAESKNNTFYNDPNYIRLIYSQNMEIDGEIGTIYLNNKKVLTES